MQLKVVCHITNKRTTENGCIFSIFNIGINIWSRETEHFLSSYETVFKYTVKYPMH